MEVYVEIQRRRFRMTVFFLWVAEEHSFGFVLAGLKTRVNAKQPGMRSEASLRFCFGSGHYVF